MSLAVVDLKRDDMKIIDVALKYGYHSPTSFNRAFQSVYGIAPSLVKLDGVSVKLHSPLSFQMVIKGAESLDFRIEVKLSSNSNTIYSLNSSCCLLLHLNSSYFGGN